MAGGDPHPPRPPQEDVENPPIDGIASTLIGSLEVHLSSQVTSQKPNLIPINNRHPYEKSQGSSKAAGQMAEGVSPISLTSPGGTKQNLVCGSINFPKTTFVSTDFPKLSMVSGMTSSPVVEGLQSNVNPTKSYASALQANTLSNSAKLGSITSNNASFLVESSSIVIQDLSLLQPTSTYKGKPSVIFKNSEKRELIESLKHVLVAKFSHGRPLMVQIRNFLVDLQLKGDYNYSLIDAKHVFIECALIVDYVKIWLKGVGAIYGFPFRIFKWTPDFDVSKESSISPVWMHLPGLPLYLYKEEAIASIANVIGRPLKIDGDNINRTKLGCASICIELDVSKPIIEEIWISFVDDDGKDVGDGFWQRVLYDSKPSYCSRCYHLGHTLQKCKRKIKDDNGKFLMGDGTVVQVGSAAGLPGFATTSRKPAAGMALHHAGNSVEQRELVGETAALVAFLPAGNSAEHREHVWTADITAHTEVAAGAAGDAGTAVDAGAAVEAGTVGVSAAETTGMMELTEEIPAGNLTAVELNATAAAAEEHLRTDKGTQLKQEQGLITELELNQFDVQLQNHVVQADDNVKGILGTNCNKISTQKQNPVHVNAENSAGNTTTAADGIGSGRSDEGALLVQALTMDEGEIAEEETSTKEQFMQICEQNVGGVLFEEEAEGQHAVLVEKQASGSKEAAVGDSHTSLGLHKMGMMGTPGQIGGKAGVVGIVPIERLEQAGQVAGNFDFSAFKARMYRLTGKEQYLARDMDNPLLKQTSKSEPTSPSRSSKHTEYDSKLFLKSKPAKASKAKAVTDPNKPKRPPTAFFVFMEVFRQEYKAKHPNNKAGPVFGKAGFERWKSLTDKEKAPYIAKADKRKAVYEKSIQAYNKKLSEVEDDDDEDGSGKEEDDDGAGVGCNELLMEQF